MSQWVEKTAKTVEEAVGAALFELKATRDQVSVEVLEEPSKGLFGILGGKQARVRVTLNPEETSVQESDDEESFDDGTAEFSADVSGDAGSDHPAVVFLQGVMKNLGIPPAMEIKEDADAIRIRLHGDAIGIVIGRRGETLDALQYLTSLVVNRQRDGYKRVIIDVENYREKREETLERLARRLADKVIRYRKDVVLEAMNPYERRIIHAALQNYRQVRTYSIGEEPNRKVVITLDKGN